MRLIRHAQSIWNEAFGRTRIDPNLPDAELTSLGFTQASEAAKALAAEAATRPISLILTSPYRRALQTAAIVNTLVKARVEIEPLVRERKAFSCDVGSSPMALSLIWPDWDFSHLDQQWWGVDGVDESLDSVEARCEAFRARAQTLDASEETLVVTHWGFVKALTGEVVENAQIIDFQP